MDQQKDRIFYLLEQIKNSQAALPEFDELLELLKDENDLELVGHFNQFYSSQAFLPEISLNDPAWKEIFQRAISVDRFEQTPEMLTSNVYHRVHFLRTAWFRYAAIFCLIAATATFLYLRTQQSSERIVQQSSLLHPGIAPGGNRATLTLANGNTIILDSVANGELASQGNTRILKLKAGSLAYNAGSSTGELLYNTISTPKGGLYQITLPDGTKVWLNAASSITFPTSFTGNERRVEVKGEVYFEVKSNPELPFKVALNNMEIQVLGTSFNVNAYADEEAIRTTLIDGSVRLYSGKSTKTLIPGQQALTGNNIASTGLQAIRIVEHASIEQVMAWKEGFFSFDNADIQTIMRQLGRWYNVDIHYEGKMPVRSFKGEIGRDLNLSDVLELLKKSHVNFRIEGRTLTVTP